MDLMIGDYESFKASLNLSKAETCRELYRMNRQTISIKSERVAVANLVRIIDSTLRLANSKGFHAMSLRDLCADTGMSMGGVYAYIRSKGDLIHLIQSHGFILTRRVMQICTQDVGDPSDRLYSAIKAHLYLSEIMRAWFYFSYMEAKNLADKQKKEAIATELEIEDMLFDVMQDGIEQGHFREANARLLASLLKAMLQDWYLKRGKYRNQKITVEQYAQQVNDVLQVYLRPALG